VSLHPVIRDVEWCTIIITTDINKCPGINQNTSTDAESIDKADAQIHNGKYPPQSRDKTYLRMDPMEETIDPGIMRSRNMQVDHTMSGHIKARHVCLDYCEVHCSFTGKRKFTGQPPLLSH
jgi:hypothetical protein